MSASNPKTLLFYAAFFPQFVDPASAPLPQLLLMSMTFSAWRRSWMAAMRCSPDGCGSCSGGRRLARLRNRLTGSVLIGAGLGLALARRQ